MLVALSFKRERANRQSGFTLLELMVVACIVAVLATILFNRVRLYQRMTEKAAVEQTIGVLQSALQLRFATLITNHRLDEVSALAQQNPMLWLVKKPVNYAGEYFGQLPEKDVAAGNWYFDLKERNLVYFVQNGAGDNASLFQLRFKTNVVLAVEGFPGAGGQVAGKVIEGVVLEQIVPYAWN